MLRSSSANVLVKTRKVPNPGHGSRTVVEGVPAAIELATTVWASSSLVHSRPRVAGRNLNPLRTDRKRPLCRPSTSSEDVVECRHSGQPSNPRSCGRVTPRDVSVPRASRSVRNLQFPLDRPPNQPDAAPGSWRIAPAQASGRCLPDTAHRRRGTSRISIPVSSMNQGIVSRTLTRRG